MANPRRRGKTVVGAWKAKRVAKGFKWYNLGTALTVGWTSGCAWLLL